jgi:glyoxylase-like metal-dependent hydrolase (beta-lactamase superfamily II)
MADLLELAPSLYRLRIPGERAHLLNCYIWLDPDGVTLVDTGWPDSAALIGAALTALKRRPGDVKRLVLSHFHEDHCDPRRRCRADRRSRRPVRLIQPVKMR